MTNQLSIIVSYVKQVNLRYYRSLHQGWDPKTSISKTQEEIREGSKSIPNQGVKMRTKTFKISYKVEENSKEMDIV